MRLSNTEFNFGKIPVNKIVSGESEILEGLDDFHYLSVSGGCSCTDVELDGNKIKFTFDPSKKVGELKQGEQRTSPVYIIVHLDKNIQEFTVDPLTGKKITNTDKRYIRLPINYVAYGV